VINVGVGDKVVIGEAEVYRDSSRVYVRDRYRTASYMVSKESTVVLKPTTPSNVPLRVADYLLLRFREPVLVSRDVNFWVKAPYELSLIVDDVVLTYVSPFKVKHTLQGEVVGGVICRYFMTDTYFEYPPKGVEALVKVVVVAKQATLLENITLPLSKVRIYVGNGGVYYNVVKVVSAKDVTTELLDEPPVPNVTEVFPGSSVASGFRKLFAF